MTQDEYFLKSNYPDFYPLNIVDIYEGYHFCPEWDYKLVGPYWTPEYDLCDCYLKLNYDKLRE